MKKSYALLSRKRFHLTACLLFALAAACMSPPSRKGPFCPKPPFADNIWGGNYGKHVHLQIFNNKTYITLSATAADEPLIWSVDHTNGQWEGLYG